MVKALANLPTFQVPITLKRDASTKELGNQGSKKYSSCSFRAQTISYHFCNDFLAHPSAAFKGLLKTGRKSIRLPNSSRLSNNLEKDAKCFCLVPWMQWMEHTKVWPLQHIWTKQNRPNWLQWNCYRSTRDKCCSFCDSSALPGSTKNMYTIAYMIHARGQGPKCYCTHLWF